MNYRGEVLLIIGLCSHKTLLKQTTMNVRNIETSVQYASAIDIVTLAPVMDIFASVILSEQSAEITSRDYTMPIHPAQAAQMFEILAGFGFACAGMDIVQQKIKDLREGKHE